MFVPFFSVDDDITALSKLKVLFLIRRLRNVDIFFLICWAFSFLVNFVVYTLIKGENSPTKWFSPIFDIFGQNNGWNSASGFCCLSFLAVSLFLRIWYGRRLYLKMKDYQEKSLNFSWNKKSKFWLMIFIPGLTFQIYPLLFRLSSFEAVHQYNL